MLWIILGIIASYLIGSLPTAYIFGRLIKGIDIRKFGSGNVGATNALRVLGKKAGITVLLIDILKGFVSVVILQDFIIAKTVYKAIAANQVLLFFPQWYNLVISNEILCIVLGVSCILGHNWTVFLNFKGGKGIATTLGVLLGFAVKIPGLNVILSLVVLTWFLVFIIFRIVSVASIISAVTLPIYMIVFKQSTAMIALGILLSLIAIFRHKANLKRILQGKEPNLSFKRST